MVHTQKARFGRVCTRLVASEATTDRPRFNGLSQFGFGSIQQLLVEPHSSKDSICDGAGAKMSNRYDFKQASS